MCEGSKPKVGDPPEATGRVEPAARSVATASATRDGYTHTAAVVRPGEHTRSQLIVSKGLNCVSCPYPSIYINLCPYLSIYIYIYPQYISLSIAIYIYIYVHNYIYTYVYLYDPCPPCPSAAGDPSLLAEGPSSRAGGRWRGCRLH